MSVRPAPRLLQYTAAPLPQFGKNMIRDSRWRVQGEQELRAKVAAPHEIEAARRMREMYDLMELRRARERETEGTGAYAGMRFTSGLCTTSVSGMDLGRIQRSRFVIPDYDDWNTDDPLPPPPPPYVAGLQCGDYEGGGGYYDYGLQETDAYAYSGRHPPTHATHHTHATPHTHLHTTSGHSSSPHNVHFIGRGGGWKTKRC